MSIAGLAIKLLKKPVKLEIWAAYISSRVKPKQTTAGLDTFTSGNKTPMKSSMTTVSAPSRNNGLLTMRRMVRRSRD